MSEPAQIERVRLVFERVVQGNLEKVLELADSNPEYHNPDYAMEAGVRSGPAEFAQALRSIMENFDFSELAVARWAARGDEALIGLRVSGTGKDSGAPLDQDSAHHYVFNGELISRFEWFRDWDAAAEGVGLDESWQQSP